MPGRNLLRRARTTDTISDLKLQPKTVEPARSHSHSSASVACTTGPTILRSVINPSWTSSPPAESSSAGWLRGAWGSEVDSDEETEEQVDDDKSAVFEFETDEERTPNLSLLSTPVFEEQSHAPYLHSTETFQALPSWPEQEDEFEYDIDDEDNDKDVSGPPSYAASFCSAVGSSYATEGPASWASSPTGFSSAFLRRGSRLPSGVSSLRSSIASYLSNDSSFNSINDQKKRIINDDDDDDEGEEDEIDISEMSNGLVNFTLDHFTPKPRSSATFISPEFDACSPKSTTFLECISPRSNSPAIEVLMANENATNVNVRSRTPIKSKAFFTSRIGSRRLELIADSRPAVHAA
ncbi:hypothetical protein CI109_106996 [Kwoniella shandongensis]|uniref:Uncharacterized protein n=1 Tax=Kwoniella shandongensis TaxID=1734106 RepID=A0A5M6C622_9TREE|nr:uncharacterized protein CI109_000752 [Kwoniella shandongensis]KAA5530574.1 hypothetical protein CI109_000752 [Kwoniella shandongensis]